MSDKVQIKKSAYNKFSSWHQHLKSYEVNEAFLKDLRSLIKKKCNKTEIRKYYPILSVYENEHLKTDITNIWLKGYLIDLKNKLKER
jgi:small-conductance mechanosensitive channel